MRALSQAEIATTAGGPAPLAAALLWGAARLVAGRVAREAAREGAEGLAEGAIGGAAGAAAADSLR